MAFNLSSISRNKGIKAPRIMVYGTHGLGKTTFAAQAPAPIFIQTEDGLGNLEVDHFPLSKQYGDVRDQITALYTEDHEFRTVVIDSVDWLQNLIDADITEKHDAKELAYGKAAVIAANYWREVLEGLNALRDEKGMATILIAHCQIKRFDSPEVEPYDRYSPKVAERSSALIQEWCDCVLFANYKTIVKKDDAGFGQTNNRGITTGERLLYTSEKPAYLAKNRFGLPESIPLSWQAFESALTS